MPIANQTTNSRYPLRQLSNTRHRNNPPERMDNNRMTNLPNNLTRLAEEYCRDRTTDASAHNLIYDIILEDPAARDAVQNTRDIHSTIMTLILDAAEYQAHSLLPLSQPKDTSKKENANAFPSFETHLFEQNSLLHAAAIVTGTQQLLVKLHSCPDLLNRTASSAAAFDYAAVAPTALESMTLTQSTQVCDDFLGLNTDNEDASLEWTFVMRHDDAVLANQSPLGAAIDAAYERATGEVTSALASDDFERWFYDDDSPIGSAPATTASERCRIAIQIWEIRELLAPP